MQTLLPWIAVIVTAIAGWALIKRYQTHMVLLFAGLALLICAILTGDANFLPKGGEAFGLRLLRHLQYAQGHCHQAEFRHRLPDHDSRRLRGLHGPHWGGARTC